MRSNRSGSISNAAVVSQHEPQAVATDPVTPPAADLTAVRTSTFAIRGFKDRVRHMTELTSEKFGLQPRGSAAQKLRDRGLRRVGGERPTYEEATFERDGQELTDVTRCAEINAHLGNAAHTYIAKGARPHEKGRDGSTALHRAAGGGIAAVINEMLFDGEAPRDINLTVTDNDGSTPLHLACAEGKDTAIDAIRRWSDPADRLLSLLRLQDKQGRTPIHRFAHSRFPTLEVAGKLLNSLASDTRIEILEMRDKTGQRACDVIEEVPITDSLDRQIHEPRNALKRLLDPASYDLNQGDADDADSVVGFTAEQAQTVIDWAHDSVPEP